MIRLEEVASMVLEMPNAYKDYPFGEQPAVYKIRSKERESERAEDVDDKMFALVDEKSMPVRISLKCDPQLAILLRDKYESVLPGYHLNKKHWNTVICSGQLDDQELKDLIRHSYELVNSI